MLVLKKVRQWKSEKVAKGTMETTMSMSEWSHDFSPLIQDVLLSGLDIHLD